ncbi:hypothetical protein [Yoonia sp. SDW83-1]|uniref:hypothetical protein n=1 Tax=Yoonia sp. SDW83-1 TaxID=3366945 RepID=UPI00398C58C7
MNFDKTDLTRLSPPVGAYRARPFQSIELEQHPDGDRIWATAMSIKQEILGDFDYQPEDLSNES